MIPEAQQRGEGSLNANHDFYVTTALLWRTPGGSQAPQSITQQEAHVVGLHCDRILAAARAFSWSAVLDAFAGETGHQHFQALLCKQIPAIIRQSELESVNWKIRILVSENGNVQILPAPVALRRISGILQWPHLPEMLHEAPACQVCQVLVDSIPTPISEFTTHKTTCRQHYDEARSRFNIEHIGPMESEVLLFNENREVMEASLCTPYFLRRGLWVTPALSSGGNAGVSRRMALEGGLCVEKTLHVDELVAGEMIWLSNAVRGFNPGRIQFAQK